MGHKIFVGFESDKTKQEFVSLMNKMNNNYRNFWEDTSDAITKTPGEQNGRSGFYLEEIAGTHCVHMLYVRFRNDKTLHFEAPLE